MLLDLLITAAAFLAARYGLDIYLHLALAGPIAVVFAVLVATWRLRVRGVKWADIGLRRPKRLWTVALWIIGLYIVTIGANALIVTQLAHILHWPATDLSRFASVRGNLPALLTILAVSWTTAAFGEEMLFRGFVLTRLERLFGGGAAIWIAVPLQAILFGLGHQYLGNQGMATAGVVGLIYGIGYVLNGRNLWPLILAHGVTDSVSMLALYSGAVGVPAH